MKGFLIGLIFGVLIGLNWDTIMDNHVEVYKTKAKEYLNGKLD